MDRWTKFLLAMIALGLWAHVAGQYLRPAKAFGESPEEIMARDVKAIRAAVEALAGGGVGCTNSKICD
jgi:hypothetical protein